MPSRRIGSLPRACATLWLVGALIWPPLVGAVELDDGQAPASAAPAESDGLPEAAAPAEPVRRATLPPLEVVSGEPAFMSLPGGTTVTPESFYSPALDRAMPYEVILPPSYGHSDRSYPVLYLLHGYAGWRHSWIELGMHQTADYLWSEGMLPQFIIVLPEGENSYYLNHGYGGAAWADYLVENLVGQIDATYRTIPAPAFRAIGGLSMGADGALQLALNHPEVFGIVGAHSATTRLDYEDAPWPLYGDEEYWRAHNPVWLIANTDRAAQLRIAIDSGEQDEWLPSTRALHEALLARGIQHEYHVRPGGHTGEYWISHEPDYLRFYAGAFVGAPLTFASPDPSGAAPW